MTKRVLIKGGRPLHGEVYVSGDTYSGIAAISYAIFSGEKKRVIGAPRSKVFIEFIKACNDCGLEIKWVEVDKLDVKIDWANFKSDFSKLGNSVSSNFLEIITNLVLTKKYSAKLPIRFRKNLGRYKRLGFTINYYEDSYFEIIRPNNIAHENIYINAFERDFYTLLSYRILKNIFPQIHIDFQNNFHPLNVFDISDEENEIKIDINRKEFNIYASLAMLNDGEIDILNYDLPKSLGFLMDLVEIGAEYEVINNRLRIWQSKKELKSNYDYTRSELDELGSCLIYLSVHSDRNIRVLCRDTKNVRNLLTLLNMVGCEIIYNLSEKRTSEILNLVVRPSNLHSFKISDDHIDLMGVMLMVSSAYKGNSIIDVEDSFENYHTNIWSNLEAIGLKVASKDS